MTLRPVTMDFRYGVDLRRQRARGVRAPHPRRDARRPHALRARRRGERGVAVHHAHPRRPGQRPPPPEFPNYAAGTWGPAGGDEAHRARRARVEAAMSLSLDQVERELARLWEEEARDVGRRARRAPDARRARERAAAARARAEGRVPSVVARASRRAPSWRSGRTGRRRRSPPTSRCTGAPGRRRRAATRSRSRPSARPASGCPATPSAWRSRTCPCASGGWATCRTSTISSTAWWSAPTWSSSTRSEMDLRDLEKLSSIAHALPGPLRAGGPHVDPPALAAGPGRAVLRRRARGSACLAGARAHPHRVLAAPGEKGRDQHAGGAALRLDRARARAAGASAREWKRGDRWAEVTLGRARRALRAEAAGPTCGRGYRPRRHGRGPGPLRDRAAGRPAGLPLVARGPGGRTPRADAPRACRSTSRRCSLRCLERPKRDPLLETSLTSAAASSGPSRRASRCSLPSD